MSFAKNMIPGPIAKALGIGSPSKVMAKLVGRWIPPGIIQGAEETAPQLDHAMSTLVKPQLAAPSSPLTGSMAPLMGAQGGNGGPLVINLDIGGRAFGQLWIDTGRRQVRALGGNVQAAIGQGQS